MTRKPWGIAEAAALDAADPLAGFRERFVIANPEQIYLDGNSLGRLPRAAVELADRLVRKEWGGDLIGGWNGGWLDLSQRIGGKIARLIGAQPDEVLIADSTSVNLFKLAASALAARPGRSRIVTDELNFPSDLHILHSALSLIGGDLRIVHSPDGITVRAETLQEAIDPQTALVALTHTVFKSGFTHDMAAVTKAAHNRGALALWDLSHSVGALPVALNEVGVDLAVGCTYKYLNGGPGAPAFLYVRRDLQDTLINPISGWLGHQDPFAFSLDYRPAAGLRRFVTGTPPILSMALIEPGVDLLLEAGVERVRAKSVAQTEFLIRGWESELAALGFELRSPRSASQRGSHVALGHPEALRISRAMVDAGVVPDFRVPDNLRLGVAPLYNTFGELARAVGIIAEIVRDRVYERFDAERSGAT